MTPEQMFGLLVAATCYVLVGTLVTALVGGRDPLAFGPPRVIVLWPVVAIVAAVGLFALWAAQREIDREVDR